MEDIAKDITGVYKRLVETNTFKRLKKITQTGNSYFKYPRLRDEKRFHHSIGTFNIMKDKVIPHFSNQFTRKTKGLKFSRKEEDIAKVTALLHDIGHGAYSHTIENVIRRFLKDENRLNEFDKYSHETRTIGLINDKNGEIYKILTDEFGEEFIQDTVEFLEFIYQEKELEEKEGDLGLLKILASMISNNVDADRLDYNDRDIKSAGRIPLTDIDEVIKSFELAITLNKGNLQIDTVIPTERIRYIATMLLERVMNYREVYYCKEALFGDELLYNVIKEIVSTKEELPDDINKSVKKFLENPLVELSNEEFLEFTDESLEDALEKIKSKTKNEKLKYLCDMKTATGEFIDLNTDKPTEYIKDLLKKAIPELDTLNTMGVVDVTRVIKTYKTNEKENVKVSKNGKKIADFQEVNDLINLEPKTVRVTGINPEIIRLELGLTKEEFDEKYGYRIDTVINTINKSTEKIKLKYLINNLRKDTAYKQWDIIDRLEESGYDISEVKKYSCIYRYYDDVSRLLFASNNESIAIRDGSVGSLQEEYLKKYLLISKTPIDESDTVYSRERTEEIVTTPRIIEVYKEMLMMIKSKGCKFDVDFFMENVDDERMKEFIANNKPAIEMIKGILETGEVSAQSFEHILTNTSSRFLYTVRINDSEVEVSVNNVFPINELYDCCPGPGFTILEISPKGETDGMAALELDKFITESFPEMKKIKTAKDSYELGLMNTHIFYKTGFFKNEDADEAYRQYGEAFDNLLNSRIGDKEYQVLLSLMLEDEAKRKLSYETTRLALKEYKGIDDDTSVKESEERSMRIFDLLKNANKDKKQNVQDMQEAEAREESIR